MATVTFYWDPDSAAGGDGTTTATSGANRAYNNIHELRDNEAYDLDAAGDDMECLRSGTSMDSNHLDTVSAWTTGTSGKLIIKSADGNRKPWESTTAFERCFYVGGNTLFLDVDGFDMEQNAATDKAACAYFGAADAPTLNLQTVTNCSFRMGTGSGTSYFGVFNQQGGRIHYANCEFLDCADNEGWVGFHGHGNPITHMRYCVAHGNQDYGFRHYSSASEDTIINCYSGGNGSSDYNVGSMTVTTCASEDTSGSSGLQSISASTTAGAYFVDLTAGAEDLRIQADSDLIEAGTDVSSDSDYAVSIDRDGNTRDATSPDVGSHEFTLAGLPPQSRIITRTASVRAAHW